MLLVSCENPIVKKATDHLFPKCAHDFQFTATTSPGCTVTGYDEYICSICSATERRNIIPALGHDESTKLVDGLCVRGGCTSPLLYALGDTGPGGGKIFYVADGVAGRIPFTDTYTTLTCHYLEAAPIGAFGEWALDSTPPFTDIPGAQPTAIGTGRDNTAAILAIANPDTDAPAALACDFYGTAPYDDWFLPSKDELNQLYINKSYVSSSLASFYWSSSQDVDNADRAWVQNLFSGPQLNNYAKDSEYSVRPIRAF